MSLSRYAPRRIRAHYLRALKALPLPASLPEPVDPNRLTILGRDRIAGHAVIFGTLTDAPRLWVAIHTTDTDSPAFGTGGTADSGRLVLLGFLTAWQRRTRPVGLQHAPPALDTPRRQHREPETSRRPRLVRLHTRLRRLNPCTPQRLPRA